MSIQCLYLKTRIGYVKKLNVLKHYNGKRTEENVIIKIINKMKLEKKNKVKK